MINEEEFSNEILSIRKDISSLENVFKNLEKKIESNNLLIKKTNKMLNEFLEESKNLEQNIKNKPHKIKKNNKEDKYDWIEDTISFDTKQDKITPFFKIFKFRAKLIIQEF